MADTTFPATPAAVWTALVVEDEALIAVATESPLLELSAADVKWARNLEEADHGLDIGEPTVAVVDRFIGRLTSEHLIARLGAASIGTSVLTGAALDEIVLSSNQPIEILGKSALDADVAMVIERLLHARDDRRHIRPRAGACRRPNAQ